MPFVTPERREQLDAAMRGERICLLAPGDRCYVYYKEMVEKWKAAPRWTTAHNIFKELITYEPLPLEADEMCARWLAWHVFFQLHVIPYELRKREENGDI